MLQVMQLVLASTQPSAGLKSGVCAHFPSAQTHSMQHANMVHAHNTQAAALSTIFGLMAHSSSSSLSSFWPGRAADTPVRA